MFEDKLKETILVVNAKNIPLPISVTLKSTDPARAIELSTDENIEYFTPVYDITTATMIVLSISSPLTNIRFTGAIDDIVRMR